MPWQCNVAIVYAWTSGSARFLSNNICAITLNDTIPTYGGLKNLPLKYAADTT